MLTDTAPPGATDYAHLVATHGSLRAAARAAGISTSTFNRRYRSQVDAASPAPVASVAPVAPSISDLTAVVATLADAVRTLMAERAGPVAAPMVPVSAIPAPAQVVERRVPAEPKRAETIVGPLGTADEYDGEIFGVTTRRKPLVGAPVTSVPRTTMVIGDSHFHPALTVLTVRAMTLAGLHAAKLRPEHVVHIGDASDMASLCRHVRNDTWRARTKPSIRQDLDCFRTNWQALNRAMFDGGVTAKRHLTLGNHDGEWVSSFEDAHPEMIGLVSNEIRDIVCGSGWSMSDYGEHYFIGDVGYVHVPLNVMGKPAGGQTAENTIAMQSTRDKVFGHTHRNAKGKRIKFGDPTVTVVNCGSCMPPYYVGDFAHNTQGAALSYGVLEVVDFDGRIQSDRFVTMRELEARYGAEADKRLR